MEGYTECSPANVGPTAWTVLALWGVGTSCHHPRAGLLGDSAIISDQMCWALGHAGVCVSVHSVCVGEELHTERGLSLCCHPVEAAKCSGWDPETSISSSVPTDGRQCRASCPPCSGHCPTARGARPAPEHCLGGAGMLSSCYLLLWRIWRKDFNCAVYAIQLKRGTFPIGGPAFKC